MSSARTSRGSVGADGREIRLDSFVPKTRLAHVVALYEFDHELRTRLGDIISMVETAFRFHIGHRRLRRALP